MKITVLFHSWFKELAGTDRIECDVAPGATLNTLYDEVTRRHPDMAAVRRSTLLAVGVDYQPGEHVLTEGDEVSFFPPVQGG